MSTRALLSRSTLGVGLAVAAALVSVTCGGDAGPDAVTGTDPTSASVGVEEDAVVATSEKPEFVAVCHYDAVTGTYSDLSVPAPALEPHLSHDDFLKPDANYDCIQGPPPPCPCFTAEAIDAGVAQCEGSKQCWRNPAGTAFGFFYTCNFEDVVAVGIDSVVPRRCFSRATGTVSGLTLEQYNFCVDEYRRSFEISSYCHPDAIP